MYGFPADKKPYCGTAVEAWMKHLGIDDHGLCSPSTSLTCSRADQLGGLRPAGSVPYTGSFITKCGIHIEVFVRVRADGLWDGVGGNVNQGVRETIRRPSDWRAIEWPGIRNGTEEPTGITVYWFEDPLHLPHRYGGWPSKKQRAQHIHDHVPASMRGLVRLINVGGRSPYAYEVYSRDDWRWGSWRDKAKRNEKMQAKSRELRRPLRPRSKVIPVTVSDHAGGVTDGTTT